ncbi:unnamed protein product, partial [Ectocarpus sp. 4 AP-2014]
ASPRCHATPGRPMRRRAAAVRPSQPTWLCSVISPSKPPPPPLPLSAACGSWNAALPTRERRWSWFANPGRSVWTRRGPTSGGARTLFGSPRARSRLLPPAPRPPALPGFPSIPTSSKALPGSPRIGLRIPRSSVDRLRAPRTAGVGAQGALGDGPATP